MRRMITAILGLWAAVLVIDARAEVTVMAVRLGASDVVALDGANALLGTGQNTVALKPDAAVPLLVTLKAALKEP